MKHIIITAIIAIASINAQAGGFSPWPDPTAGSKLASRTSTSAAVKPAPFYSGGLPQIVDTADATQLVLDIRPYYLASR